MSDIKELLREAATALRDYERDSLAAKLEAAAESLGEPVAWLVQHPKYMIRPTAELAKPRYHAPDIMEREKAQGWIFTPLFSTLKATTEEVGGEEAKD